MLNPAKLLRLKNAWSGFSQRHPKFVKFLETAGNDYLREGTIIDVTIKDPQGKEIHSNIRVTGEDMDLYRDVRSSL